MPHPPAMPAALRLAQHTRRVVLWTAALALVATAGCNGAGDGPPMQKPSAKGAPLHPVTYRPRLSGPGSGLQTDLKDHHGKPVKAPCRSCHDGKLPARKRNTGTSLKAFHVGLTMQHGRLSCLTCHNADNYDTLRLADSTPVPFDDLMQLCGQCHGPQKRDYDHGSHGGMTGYWDRTKGPRVRNQCVHCHDPHAPAYVGVVPGPRPKDRFLLNTSGGHGAGDHGAADHGAADHGAADHGAAPPKKPATHAPAQGGH